MGLEVFHHMRGVVLIILLTWNVMAVRLLWNPCKLSRVLTLCPMPRKHS
ncbi:hypothetical protein VPHK444_0206 [Vibrio phage K444]